MEQGTRRIVARAVMSALVLVGRPASADEREPPTLVVYVSDLAGTDPGILESARSQLDRIFEDAGVRPVWRVVEEGVYNPRCDGFSVFVTLLSQEMVLRLSLQGMNGKTLGSAASAAGRAFIHPTRIQDLASRTRTQAGDLMGRVMAHEVGHLLLPDGHSQYGIMTAGMHTDPTVSARFTVPEARAIRGRVKAESAAFARGTDCGS